VLVGCCCCGMQLWRVRDVMCLCMRYCTAATQKYGICAALATTDHEQRPLTHHPEIAMVLTSATPNTLRMMISSRTGTVGSMMIILTISLHAWRCLEVAWRCWDRVFLFVGASMQVVGAAGIPTASPARIAFQQFFPATRYTTTHHAVRWD